MRTTRFLFALAVFLAVWPGPRPAVAWIAQPPYDDDRAPEEIEAFQQASGAALTAFSRFYAELARAESEHVELDMEEIGAIVEAIDPVVASYLALSQSQLVNIPLNLTALRDVSALLADDLETSGITVNNAADFAKALGEIAAIAREDISFLTEFPNFGPDDPLIIPAREAMSRAVARISQFISVGNAGSAAIGYAR